MAFITKKFFIDNFCSSSTDVVFPDELDLLIGISSDIIDSVCNSKISDCGGIDSLPEHIAEKVKMAVCAETAFLDRNGGITSLDSTTPVQMSLGKFSYMHASGTVERKAFPVSPLAVSYLEAAGLLYRGL